MPVCLYLGCWGALRGLARVVLDDDVFVEDGKRRFQLRRPRSDANERTFLRIFDEWPCSIFKGKLDNIVSGARHPNGRGQSDGLGQKRAA